MNKVFESLKSVARKDFNNGVLSGYVGYSKIKLKGVEPQIFNFWVCLIFVFRFYEMMYLYGQFWDSYSVTFVKKRATDLFYYLCEYEKIDRKRYQRANADPSKISIPPLSKNNTVPKIDDDIFDDKIPQLSLNQILQINNILENAFGSTERIISLTNILTELIDECNKSM